jgi:hypothetical protein
MNSPAKAVDAAARFQSGGAVLARFVVVALLLWVTVRAAEDNSLEYKVKAGYLFNFAKYVDWPPRAHATAESPFVIGVLGGQGPRSVIEEVLRGKTVFGRPLEVRLLERLEDHAGCHILFVTRDSKITAEQASSAAGTAPVLLVGETESFAESGGMIGFVRQDEQFRVVLNLESVNASGLKASAKLATVAKRVRSKAKQP